MNRISKEKRNQVIVTVLVILIVLAGLYYGLISAQRDRLNRQLELKKRANDSLNTILETKRSSAKIEAELAEVSQALKAREEHMASGDAYTWMIDFIRTFKKPYNVDIRQFTSKGESAMSMIPRYPYRQMTVSLMGSGYYQDIGRFVADFENAFPSSRITNVELTPESSQDDRDSIIFRFDVISLVRTDQSRR